MANQFFGTKSDANLAKHMLIVQPDMYISEVKYTGRGVVSKTGDVITLTPAVSPVWGVDAYLSVAGFNLVVKSGAKVFEAKVQGNAATSLEFDATEAVNIADGLAGAAGDFTTGASLEFYLMPPHDEFAWGDFGGYVKEMELNATEEVAKFTYGIPEKKIRQDTVKNEWSVKGKNFNITNPDVFAAIFNAVAYGKNDATQWEKHFGFAPPARKEFRITLAGNDVNDKQVLWQIFRGQFKLEGAVALSGNEHKGAGFMIEANADPLRPATADAGRVQVIL